MDRDDSFARILDDDRAERDLAIDAEAAQPAPPPPIETPTQPDPVEATSEGSADGASTESYSAAATAFQAALNNLNSDDAAKIVDGDTTEQAATESSAKGEVAATANATKPGVAANAAASATQTNAALLILANASGATTASGPQAADQDDADTSDDAGAAESTSTEGSGIAALASVAQPITAQAVTQATSATGDGDASVKPALPNGASAPPVPAAAGEANANPVTAKDGAPADAAPRGANPASAQANAHPAASSATQANAPATAAVSTDAAQAAANAGSAASQASAQPAATSNPLTDTTRAVATPPALQSAPAVTIQVYTRFIERADGRAQRFEVRLDPAELGRVDVRIEIGADRKVHAVMAAHDSAALTDLMRGQKALERALSDAGIDLADNGLRFEIAADAGRGGASQQREGNADGRSGQPDAWRKFDTVSVPVSAEAAAATTPTRRSQHLDLVA